jgi:cytochrome P450
LASKTRLSAAETAAVVADVVAPLLARGVIARRPRVVDVLDRLDADSRAVRRLQRVRARHGPGPLALAVPGRNFALVLDPGDARRVLAASPDPFTPANLEKRAALAHFQPHGVLISEGEDRARRRRFNEAVLETGRPVHGEAGAFLAKVSDEADELAKHVVASGQLGWDRFAVSWWRLVRRVTLGDRARDDHTLTDMLRRLRQDANWAFLKPRRRGLRDEFLARVRQQLANPEPATLAALASAAGTDGVAPEDQFAHWLFAFDAAGMASFRALALLDSHPEQAERARSEVAGADLSRPHDLPFLRACVLDSVRLWPTTPAILRDTTAETKWGNGTLPAGAGLVIFAPFFHRDDERLPFAHQFAPDVWLDGRPPECPLVPFSQGPGECPGRDLVLLLTSALIANLLTRLALRLPPELRLDRERLPGTLSPFRLRFLASPA